MKGFKAEARLIREDDSAEYRHHFATEERSTLGDALLAITLAAASRPSEELLEGGEVMRIDIEAIS